MIGKGEIQKIANERRVLDTQIEKDYVIGWILKGISQNEYLSGHLVFKGGTVLKKVWFDDYRFSEDMDFTFQGEGWDALKLEAEIRSMFQWIYEETRIVLSLNPEESSPAQYRCHLAYKGPLGGGKDIKCDISKDELIYHDIEIKPVLDNYSDAEEICEIKVYSLEESLVEKLRCTIQRTIPRDIYDIWYLMEVAALGIEEVAFGFREKAAHKNLDSLTILNVLKGKEKKYKAGWEKSLKHQINDVPEFDEVWRDIMRSIKKMLALLTS